MWIEAKIEQEHKKTEKSVSYGGEKQIKCVFAVYLSMVTRYFKSSSLINLTFERFECVCEW